MIVIEFGDSTRKIIENRNYVNNNKDYDIFFSTNLTIQIK